MKKAGRPGLAWWCAAVGVGGIVCTPLAAYAQDVETSAWVQGRTVPPGYYARITQHTDFFEGTRGWRRKAAAVFAANTPLSGSIPILVIPTLFADSPEPPVPHTDIQRVLFDVLRRRGPWPTTFLKPPSACSPWRER